MKKQVKNKNSDELELARLRLLPFRALISAPKIAHKHKIDSSLVSKVLSGERTDRYNIINEAEKQVRKAMALIRKEAGTEDIFFGF